MSIKKIKHLISQVKKIKCIECKNQQLERWNDLWLHLKTQRKYWCDKCNTETIVNHSQEFIDSQED